MITALRDSLVTWVADRGDTRPVAIVTHVGIRSEQLIRSAGRLQPDVVRRLWGLASQVDLDRALERMSALEHRVRALEARSDRKEDA